LAAASKGCERPNRADMDQGKRGGGSPLSWSWVFSPLVATLVWHGCVWGHLRDSLHCFPCCPTFSCDNSQSQPHPSAHCCRLFPTCGSRHQHPFGNSSQQERGGGGGVGGLVAKEWGPTCCTRPSSGCPTHVPRSPVSPVRAPSRHLQVAASPERTPDPAFPKRRGQLAGT